MRHGTPFLFGQVEEVRPAQQSSDRYCYSTDSQKSTSNLSCCYKEATYELGQVCLLAMATIRAVVM